MKIYNKVMLCRFLCQPIVKVNHFLIVPIHKINLKPFNSKLSIMFKSFVHLLAQR